jgi:hypothetical protein
MILEEAEWKRKREPRVERRSRQGRRRGRASDSPIAAIAKLFHSSTYTLTEWPCIKFNRLGSGRKMFLEKGQITLIECPYISISLRCYRFSYSFR